MSSSPISTLITVRQGDYVSLAILVAVGYDYILTFSKEIEYIWSKPWTWVSTLFIFVRYFGLFSLAVAMLREIIWIVSGWTYILFIGAADLVMALRVWAMFCRSRLILCILLGLLFVEIISLVLATGILSDPTNLFMVDPQTPNDSLCIVGGISLTWTYVMTISQVAFAVVMYTLVIVQFGRQLLQMYHANKQWQLNRYINLFVKEGILYFFSILLYNIINMLYTAGKTPEGWQMVLLFIIEFVPLYTLTPQFILGMRELYARDTQGRRGVGGLDTGFGLLSLPSRSVGTEIAFANFQQGEEDVEEIEMWGNTGETVQQGQGIIGIWQQ